MTFPMYLRDNKWYDNYTEAAGKNEQYKIEDTVYIERTDSMFPNITDLTKLPSKKELAEDIKNGNYYVGFYGLRSHSFFS